jgi:hypothetical protein
VDPDLQAVGFFKFPWSDVQMSNMAADEATSSPMFSWLVSFGLLFFKGAAAGAILDLEPVNSCLARFEPADFEI